MAIVLLYKTRSVVCLRCNLYLNLSDGFSPIECYAVCFFLRKIDVHLILLDCCIRYDVMWYGIYRIKSHVRTFRAKKNNNNNNILHIALVMHIM